MENIIIDELATKRLHKALEGTESLEHIFQILMDQVEKEEE